MVPLLGYLHRRQHLADDTMTTTAGLFGSNSDGSVRLMEWLDVMCLRCRHENAAQRKQLNGGGIGCDLAARAISDPHHADMPEWSPDASPLPRRLNTLGGGPWPVCMQWQPRATRSDKGTRRAPAGQGILFG